MADFQPFLTRLTEAGLSPARIASFRRSYARLCGGERGLISDSDLECVGELPELEQLPEGSTDADSVVMIKLNGGLGTSMGLQGPKGVLPVKSGLSFLDLCVHQVRHLHGRLGQPVPLLFMNSFVTHADTLEALARLEYRSDPFPVDFLQGKVPKVLVDGLGPADCSRRPEVCWCPPGHGDIYLSLAESGVLDRLLAHGVRTAFVSNIDNTGAGLDLRLLHWFQESGLDFAMEVTRRTASDRKGGHLARRRSDGRLLLREVAQCPPEDRAEFEDIERHRYFNTNNLWINLVSLRRSLDGEGGLDLPLIVNRKALDPRDSSTPAVYQLETAMGAAISVFAHSGAVCVPRWRFAPVKTISDLLAVRSDAYRLDADYQLRLDTDCGLPPQVDLDPTVYRWVSDLDEYFLCVPSLRACRRFQVTGPVRFGHPLRLRGEVAIRNGGALAGEFPVEIQDLEGDFEVHGPQTAVSR